jgi:hypothetical protein
MKIEPIDPRTDPRWETAPTHGYRVVFWQQGPGPPDRPGSLGGWGCSDQDLEETLDVHEVIEWAEAEARRLRSMYALYAKVDRGSDRGLVWLAGINPTTSGPNFERQHPSDVTPRKPRSGWFTVPEEGDEPGRAGDVVPGYIEG